MTNQKYVIIGSRKFVDMWDANEILELGLEKYFPHLQGEELEESIAKMTLEYSKKEIVARILELAKKHNTTVSAPSTLNSAYERYKERYSDGTESDYWTIEVVEYVCIDCTGYPYENWTILTDDDVKYASHNKLVGSDDEPYIFSRKTPKGKIIGKMISYQEEEETFWDFEPAV